MLLGGLAVNVTVSCHQCDMSRCRHFGQSAWPVLVDCWNVQPCANGPGPVAATSGSCSRHVNVTIAEGLSGSLRSLFNPGLAGHVRSGRQQPLLQQRPLRIVWQSWFPSTSRLTARCCFMSHLLLAKWTNPIWMRSNKQFPQAHCNPAARSVLARLVFEARILVVAELSGLSSRIQSWL